jgi:hypothetical protein
VIFHDWSTSGARLEQNGGNLLFFVCHDWSKSRLEQRLEQLEQNGGKLPLARNLRTRARSHPYAPFRGYGVGSDAGTREAVAAASVWLLRWGYATDMTLGCCSIVGSGAR